MADNVNVTPGSGATLAADDIGGVLFPRTKLVIGADGVNNGDISASNPMPVTGAFYQATQPVSVSGSVAVTGTFWQATQPISGTVTANAGTGTMAVSAASLPLPSGAATETTLGGVLTTTAFQARTPALGQTTMSSSSPVAIASDQSALSVNPAAALNTTYSQAGVIAINTVLMTLDCSVYRHVSFQCTSMGTTGVVTPEWSNDNATWVGCTFFTSAGATAATFNAAGLWHLPMQARYLRLRLSTATTAGTTTLNVYQYQSQTPLWISSQGIAGTVTANIGTGSLAAGTNAIGDVGIQYRANATGAASIANVLSPTTPAGQVVKGSAGRLLGIHVSNTNAAVRYLKIFNATSITPGTTSATTEIAIPAGQTLHVTHAGGIGFSTGIVIMVTAAQGLTNNGAITGNEVNGFAVFA